MASQTFINLSAERQETILITCYKEFALKGYSAASLSAVIKELGLAKGSFYRYFKSKKELFAYLVHEASRRRLSKLDDLMINPKVGFFKLVRQNFMDKVQFDLENPVIGGFLYRVLLDRDNSEISDIISQLFNMIIEQTCTILELPKYKNKLVYYDAEMVAFHIFHMQMWLYDYIAFKFDIDYVENIKNGKPILNISKKEVEDVINQVVLILKNGIKAKKS